MTKGISQPPPPGLGVGDVAYVLFKHKWKILLVTLLGVAAATIYYFSARPVYGSQAKLMVRYVVERSAVDQVQNTTSLSASQSTDSVIQSELEILTSWDLAEKVGGMPGMEGLSAGVISGGLKASAVKGSNVILVSFKHQDPALAQKVLDQLVQQYFIKHLEIHRSKEAAKFVTSKVEQSRTKLRGTEDELTKLKTDSGIFSVEGTMATLNKDVAKAQSDLSAAEAELAEERARAAAFEQFAAGEDGIPPAPMASKSTKSAVGQGKDGAVEPVAPAGATAAANPAAGAKATEPAGPANNTPKPATQVAGAGSPVIAVSGSQHDIARPDSEYASAVSALKILETERREMLKVFREEHEDIKSLDAKIARQRSIIEIYKQQSLEESTRRANAARQAQRAQILALEAKTQKLRENLAAILKSAAAFTAIMPRIAEKELARDIEMGNYKYMAASLEKAQVDEALDGSKMPNISIVQEASPSGLDVSKRNKIVMGIAGGSFGAAIALTLFIGLILHKKINRPQEIENRLGIPLLISIPYFGPKDLLRLSKGANGSNRLKWNGRQSLAQSGAANAAAAADSGPPVPNEMGKAAPWETGHFIRPYSESIRDRLGLYFEIKGITHKPKLIGVTGFSQGAGTSTLAAGIAAALSETGEGKVLMVDMTANGSEGEVHPFFAGRPAVPLDHALKPAGNIQSTADNLYLATADPNSPGSGSLGLNKLRRIMLDLQASDFDYMVFDMPALGQTSSTAAMAGLMDQVLVIVESEASSPEEIKRGFRDLVESRAKVSVVFNKARTYGPKALIGQA